MIAHRRPGVGRLWRTLPFVTAAIAVALLLAGFTLTWYIDRTYTAQKLDEITVQARILASTMTAALSFNDRDAAQEYVDALRVNPEVRWAAVYNAQGDLLARYPQTGPPIPPLPGRTGTPQAADDTLRIALPVTEEGNVLGTVWVANTAEPFARRAQRYATIALLLTSASLVVAVLAFAQRALARLNAELEQRAAELAAANQNLLEEMRQREQAEIALRQAQKMEAIGQLTGGVAHDFNNLLQIILGSLDRLRSRSRRAGGLAAMETDFERLTDAAIRGAQRAASLTQRLLAFSRRQPLAPKSLDLNKLVAGMSELLSRTLGETIQVETVLASGLWRVFADENQLENALLNLAVNARDAMPSGGKLTIETANTHLDTAYVRIEEEVKPGQYAMIAVTDTGTGMSTDTMGRAFEPFFTTKDIGKGTGLGLSQVYGFIKQSGGHVKLYSEAGEGTTVKLYLPRADAADGPAEAEPEAQRAPIGDRRAVILVVEDEDDVRALTVEMLRDLGYGVLQAADAEAALAMLRQDQRVRLLFTDVGLPGQMNGRQLAEAAQRERPELAVLYATGYARNAIVHHGRLDAGVEMIGKPFSQAELTRRVREIMAKADPATQ